MVMISLENYKEISKKIGTGLKPLCLKREYCFDNKLLTTG